LPFIIYNYDLNDNDVLGCVTGLCFDATFNPNLHDGSKLVYIERQGTSWGAQTSSVCLRMLIA
jgi:hypothetical protein